MLGRLLDLRGGEGRVALVLFAHLFFVTATAIVLSAAKNGLFLSAYPAALIPHVIVAGAVTTAAVAILFAGATSEVPRRARIEWTAGVAAITLVASRFAFLWDPRTSFVLYLWFSILVAVVVTLAWGAVGDLLTGRQSRRLMPLLIAGTSVAGVGAGFGLAPAAARFGTPDLLLGAALSLVLGAAVLRFAPRPAQRPARTGLGFVTRVRRGVFLIRSHRLLALLAGGVALTAAMGTLVDYQFKAVLQAAYDRDAITSLFGILAGAVGLGTLVVQALASRVIFRRWGLVSGAYAQAAMVAMAAVSVAITGWLAALVALRFVDETARFTLAKTVEQVSVAPFAPDTRSSALTVLGGVLKPLATAATGLLLALVAPLVGIRGLAVLTAVAAFALFTLFRRHPVLYRAALEEALSRHTLHAGDDDADGSLIVLDRAALEVVDRALDDADPAVRLFAISILRRAPRSEAVPRLHPLLDSAVPEIRAEAAVALVEAAGELELPELDRVRALLADDPSPDVVRSLLEAAHMLGPAALASVAGHLDHEDEGVRRAALVALARCETRFGGDRATRLVERLLASGDPEDRRAGIDAVAILGFARLADSVFDAARDARTRRAALAAFAALGGEGEPWIDRMLADRDLEDADLAAMAAALAELGHHTGLRRIVELAAVRSRPDLVVRPLHNARRRGRMKPVPTPLMRRVLTPVLGDGARSGVLAGRLRRLGPDVYVDALRADLEVRHARAADGVMASLALAYDPARLDGVAPHLRATDPVTRSNALELLEGILEPEDRAGVVAFYEGFDSDERLADAARAAGARIEADGRHPMDAVAALPDPWLRSCAEFVRARLRSPALAVIGADHHLSDTTVQESPMLPLMEIVFFLKSSPLFRPLPGEELARVARLADTVHLDPG